MRGALAVVFLFLMLLPAGTALSAEFAEFPQFRYISGLPGGGFGVSPEGKVGFDGAMQISIPVAYTPCWGNVVAGIWSGAVDEWRVRMKFRGDEVNGTGLLAVGLGKPEHGIYFGHMFTGWAHSGEAVYNVQVQLRGDDWDKPAVAIGCQDLSERRERWIRPTRHGYERTIYGVATGRLGSEDHFVYVTLGFGNGRYRNRPFAGVSWPCSEKVTVMFEYDGFNPNVGVALSLFSRFSDRRWNVVSLISLVDCQRFNLGTAFTYSR
ncbi:MAG: hypothetical protein H5T86_07590 [Armatimonadetes bacterium]|nr:hypothetical protein [Armatimonadota bacterium]